MSRLRTSLILLLLSSCEIESMDGRPSDFPLFDADVRLNTDRGDEPDTATVLSSDALDPYVQYPTTCSDTMAGRAGPFSLSSGDIEMGEVPVGEGKRVEVLVTNTSSAPVAPPFVGIESGQRFGISAYFGMGCYGPVQPGKACILDVIFLPPSRGRVTGVIRITARTDESAKFAVCGTGIPRL